MSGQRELHESHSDEGSSSLSGKGMLFAIGIAFALMIFWIVRDEAAISHEKEVEKHEHDLLHEIEQVEDIGEHLDSRYFAYDSRWHRNSLTRSITFPKGSSVINTDDEQWLLGAARAIESAVHDIKTHDSYGLNFTFTVVIEGRSSNDGYPDNNVLSYKRALAVRQLWERSQVFQVVDSVDLQTAGSGPAGVGRSSDEQQNQCIMIHIIPKIGHLPDGLGT